MGAVGWAVSVRSRVVRILLALLCYAAAMTVASPAQTLTTLHSSNGSDGVNPYREALVQSGRSNETLSGADA